MPTFPIDVVLNTTKAIAGSRQMQNALGGIDNAGTRTTNIIEKMEQRVKQLAVTLATVKLLGIVKEAALLSQRFSELGLAMGVVARNVNVTGRQMAATEKSLQSLGISILESRQTILKLASANIDLKNATELADLARNAAIVGQINTSEALNRIVLGVTNASLVTLRSVGIVTTFDTAYKKLADQLGVNITQLTDAEKQQARLNAVIEKSPALVGLYEESMLNAGKQLRSTDRLVENLKVKIGGLFDATALLAVSQYTGQLKTLDQQVENIIQDGRLVSIGDDIARGFAKGADVIATLGLILRTASGSAVALAGQLNAIVRFDFQGAANIGQGFLDSTLSSIGTLGRFTEAVEDQISARANLAEADRQAETGAFGLSDIVQIQTESISRQIAAEEALLVAKNRKSASNDKLKTSSDSLKDSQEAFINGLITQQQNLGLTATEVLKLDAAMLGLGNDVTIQINNLETTSQAFDDYNEKLAKAAELTQRLRTPQEKFNDSMSELTALKPHISIQTFNREVRNLEKTLEASGEGPRGLFKNVEQFGIQAARSIQRSFANILIDPKGKIEDQFANLAKRAAAQFSSAFILSGVENLFRGKTFTGDKIDPGGAGATNKLLGLFSGILDNGKSSKGTNEQIAESTKATSRTLTSLVDKARFNANPGAGALAITGAGLTGAGGGVTALAGGLATFGGPVGIAVAAGLIATDFLDKKFGDFSIDGAFKPVAKVVETALNPNKLIDSLVTKSFFPSDFVLKQFGVPELGKIGSQFGPSSVLNKLGVPDPASLITKFLFGRGPLERERTTLEGDVTSRSSNLAQTIQFKADGGVFRSNKVDNVIIESATGVLLNKSPFSEASEGGLSGPIAALVPQFSDAAIQIGKLVDLGLSEVDEATRRAAKSLGLGEGAIDSFTSQINLLTEKGESITESDIGGEILRIADELAVELLPAITGIRKPGELASQALTRIRHQTDLLTKGLAFMGNGVTESRNKILSFGIDIRSDFIDKLGGSEKLASDLDFFASTFLSTQEKLTPLFQQLDIDLDGLGFSANLTRNQFKDLVKSFDDGAISLEQYKGLLDFQRDFDAVKTLQETLAEGSNNVSEVERTVVNVKRDLELAYQRERNEMEQTAERLDNFAKGVRDFRKGLLLSDISPLTPQQKLETARNQFNRTRSLASSGDEDALARLPDVSRAFLEASKVFNASSATFTSDFNLVQSVLTSIERSTQRQGGSTRSQIEALENTVSGVISIDQKIATTNDLLTELIAIGNGRGEQGATTSSRGRTVTLLPLPDVGFSRGSLPSLNTGVNHLSRDMVVQAHAGEEIRPFRQVAIDRQNATQSNATLKSLLRETVELRKELEQLRVDQKLHTKSLNDVAILASRQNANDIAKSNEARDANSSARKERQVGFI